MKMIGVLDCNNFFVSCERLFRPDLLKRPVVVMSGENGCVVARSQEVKDMSIPVGVPYFQIKDILKNTRTEILLSNRALYKDISKRVFDVVRSEIGDIEVYSIDECFFTVDENVKSRVQTLKEIVEREVGIPVSIGVGFSKTQAKYINSVAKKTKRVEVWNNQVWCKNALNINLSDVWGVGLNRVRKLSEQGIKTVKDLCQMNESECYKAFGVFGVRLRGELLGNMIFKIESVKSVPQSITSSRSLVSSTSDKSELEENIKYHLNKVTFDLAAKDLLASSIKVFVLPGRHSGFSDGINAEFLMEKPTNNLFSLQKTAISIFNKYYKKNVKYKQVGVTLLGVISREFRTRNLFENEVDNTEDISRLLMVINKNHGGSILRLGGVKGGSKLDFANKSHSPKYTTDWNELPIVKV